MVYGSLDMTLNLVSRNISLLDMNYYYQVFLFIKHISTMKNVPKTFKTEDIDGAALMNISKTDLMKNMHFNSSTAGSLSEIIKHLRNGTIKDISPIKHN